MRADDLKPKVFQWLTELFKGVEPMDDGGIFVPSFGSTALFVGVDDVFNGQHVRVRIDAPILMDVPLTDELVQYIGIKSNDFVFGSLALILEHDGARTGILAFRQTLLGDAIDKIELEVASQVVALTADDLDDNLARRFGGSPFYR